VEEHIFKLNSRKLKLDERMRSTESADEGDEEISQEPVIDGNMNVAGLIVVSNGSRSHIDGSATFQLARITWFSR
jgi:hypothetical protein